jgi:chromosome segregation ATPase
MQYDILHTMADSSDAEDANSSSLSGAVEDSAVFSVIDELVRAARVQDYEGNTLKAKYKRLHTVAGAVLERSRLYSKRVRALKNDVLKEKIVLEKVNMEEEMEGNKVRELDDEREAVQRELEESEQRDSMVKFELTELQKTHHELRSALLRIQKENHDLVGPMLAQLNDDVQHYEEELRQQEEVVEKENKMKKDLAQRYDLLQERNKEKQAEIIVLRQELEPARVEPHRVRRNLDSIERAVTNMHAELILIRESTKYVMVEVATVGSDEPLVQESGRGDGTPADSESRSRGAEEVAS